jgi:hypothetical protein
VLVGAPAMVEDQGSVRPSLRLSDQVGQSGRVCLPTYFDR